MCCTRLVYSTGSTVQLSCSSDVAKYFSPLKHICSGTVLDVKMVPFKYTMFRYEFRGTIQRVKPEVSSCHNSTMGATKFTRIQDTLPEFVAVDLTCARRTSLFILNLLYLFKDMDRKIIVRQ
jgi:hypothetical protein